MVKHKVINVVMSGKWKQHDDRRQWDQDTEPTLVVSGPILACENGERAQNICDKMNADIPDAHRWVELVELIEEAPKEEE